MEFNIEELVQLYEKNNGNITQAVNEYCIVNGLEYDDTIRRQGSKVINKYILEMSDVEGNITINGKQQLTALKQGGKIMNIEEYCDYYGLNYEDVKTYKIVTHTGTPYYNIQFNTVLTNQFESFGKKLVDEIKNLDIKFKPLKYGSSTTSDNHLLVIDPADIHIGKLASSFQTGTDYNSEVAVKYVKEGVNGVLDKSKGFNIEKILFVAGNDVLHVDTPRNTTTSGTQQDVDGMWFDNFLKAKQLYIDVISQLVTKAPVHFVYNPSNHDFMSGFFLAEVIQAYFANHPDITFDIDMRQRKYTTYGNNLICTTHGDGAKQSLLPMLMADEAENWSNVKHRYIYAHHVHHKIGKDYPGVTFETLRSPSAADSWHYIKGFTGTPKAIEGFIHHTEYGQVARITHIL